MSNDKIDSMLLTWVQHNLRTILKQEPEKLLTIYQVWSAWITWGYLLSQQDSEAPSSWIALETQTDIEAATLCAITDSINKQTQYCEEDLKLHF